jgi:hypothetical protein
VIGFFVMLGVWNWHPDMPHKPRAEPVPAMQGPLDDNKLEQPPRDKAIVANAPVITTIGGNLPYEKR